MQNLAQSKLFTASSCQCQVYKSLEGLKDVLMQDSIVQSHVQFRFLLNHSNVNLFQLQLHLEVFYSFNPRCEIWVTLRFFIV